MIVHILPVWNKLNQPIWVVATSRHSLISRHVESTPLFTRWWREAWGWEIDHAEFRPLSKRLKKYGFSLCQQCADGSECEVYEWRLHKIGMRPRKPNQTKAPKEEQEWEYDTTLIVKDSEMSPEEAAEVLGIPWPIDATTAVETIKLAFTKAALKAHTDKTGSGDEGPMKRVLEAREVLKGEFDVD